MDFDSYLDLYNKIKSCHLRECILNWSFHIIVFLFVIIIFGKLLYGRFHNFQIMIYWHHKNISFYWLYGILHVFANCVRAAWFVQGLQIAGELLLCYTRKAIIITILFENALRFATPLFGDLRMLFWMALPLFITQKKIEKSRDSLFSFNVRFSTSRAS